MKIYGQLESAALESLNADPSTAVQGRIYYNSTSSNVIVDNGTTKRALLRNDTRCVLGNDATAANNVRIHKAGASSLQFVKGDDATTEDSVSTSLAQIGFRVANFSAAPAVGNLGRMIFNTTAAAIQVDVGAAFAQLATLAGTESFTNKTLVAPVADVISLTDQVSAPATPAAGTTKVYTKSGKIYKIGSDGLETLVGSGGSGGSGGTKNYLTTYNNNTGNGDFEFNTTTGWSLFNTTLTGVLPTGAISAGATSITTFATTSSSPLAGTYSLQTTGGTNFTAGQGFISSAFTIDREDQTKVLSFKVNYAVTQGAATMNFSGTSANSFAVYVYQVNGTGAGWVQPAGVYGMTQSSGCGAITGTFQTALDATQYRLAVVCINSTSGQGIVLWDDISVGPQAMTVDARVVAAEYNSAAANTVANNVGTFIDFGTKETDSHSAVLGAGTGNVTTTNTGWRYVAPTAGRYQVSAMVGFAAVSKTNLTVTYLGIYVNGGLVHQGSRYDGQSTGTNGFLQPSVSGNVSLNAGDRIEIVLTQGTGGSVTQATGSDTRVTINRIGVTSAGDDGRVIAAKFALTANTAVGANAVIPYNSTVVDSAGGFVAGGRYQAPVSGVYAVTFSGSITVGSNTTVYAYKNGGLDTGLAVATTTAIVTGTTLLNCVAGDLIDVRPDLSVTVSANSRFSVNRLSGPSVPAASESVTFAGANTAGTTISTSSPTIPFAAAYDSHGRWSVDTYTVGMSGKYRVNAVLRATANLTTAQTFSVTASQAGSASVSRMLGLMPGNGASVPRAVGGAATFNCVAGDTIKITSYSDVTTTLDTGASSNHLEIERIGN